MNKNKIDFHLYNIVSMLDEDKKWECIVHAKDFLNTKKILLHNKIKVLNEYLFINSFRVLATKNQLSRLSRFSQVKYISSLAKVTAQMNVAKKILNVDNHCLTGDGITVAFIDTGIENHLDFCMGEKRIIFFKDFINDKQFCYDDNGHGTFVAGVCSGNGAMSAGNFCGIAPKTKIISLKALNGKGEASADKILDAMQWVYENHRNFNIKVVCMSFGSEPLGLNDPIMKGAEILWQEGVVVVAAAGNSGPEYASIKSPGVSGKIITVGGFNDNRINNTEYNENYFEIADFSSRGPAFQKYKPDLVAPSVDITSCNREGGYTTLSGTSVATPMVAGLVCLMLEKYPKLSPIEVKRGLLSCCKKICFNKNFEGFGYPQIDKILK